MLKQWKARLKNKKGFTLIELIVVVAIIAILLALLVPNVMRFVRQASETAANANAKTIFVAAQTYITDEYTNNRIVPTLTLDQLENAGYISGDAANGVADIQINNDAVEWVRWRRTAGDSILGRYPADAPIS